MKPTGFNGFSGLIYAEGSFMPTKRDFAQGCFIPLHLASRFVHRGFTRRAPTGAQVKASVQSARIAGRA